MKILKECWSRSPKCGMFGLVATLVATVLCSGCLVTSIYPYYHDADVTFDARLLGVWLGEKKPDSTQESWTFEKLDERTYKLTMAEGEERHEFDVHLFSLRGTNFLDCLHRERPDYATPVHLLLRVNSMGPNLELRPLNLEWLGKLLEKEPAALRHAIVPKKVGDGDNGGDLVLTADTAELQKFILKHLDNAEAWTGEGSLKRK